MDGDLEEFANVLGDFLLLLEDTDYKITRGHYSEATQLLRTEYLKIGPEELASGYDQAIQRCCRIAQTRCVDYGWIEYHDYDPYAAWSSEDI